MAILETGTGSETTNPAAVRARWVRSMGTHPECPPKGQLSSAPVHSGQAEREPGDTRFSEFSREIEHLSF